MYIHGLPNAAAGKISVTATATTLFDLMDTAASEAINLAGKLNAVDLVVEDGDIRMTLDGNAPTATNGVLLSSGNTYFLRGVPLTKMKLIRVGGSDVACSVQVGMSDDSESSSSSAHEVTLEASGVVIGDVAGDVAHDAVDSGNPMKIGGYASDPTSMPSAVASGDRVNAVYDLYGREVGTLGTQIAGEDLGNDVLKVEERFSYSAVAVVDTQVKASAGFLHTVTISCNDAAPTAGSLKIYDNTAESGTVVFNHTFTTTPFVPFTVTLDATMGTGIYVGMTTTGDVNFSCSYR